MINLFFSKYQVETDLSISPFSDIKIDKGALTNNLGQSMSYQIKGTELARIVMRRASTEVLCKRNYKKIDETFSYIGGLFSTIMAMLVILNFYTEMSF